MAEYVCGATLEKRGKVLRAEFVREGEEGTERRVILKPNFKPKIGQTYTLD